MATSVTACFARVGKTLSPEDREQVLAPLRREILAQLDAQRTEGADARALAVGIIDRMLAADGAEAAVRADATPAPAPSLPAPKPPAAAPATPADGPTDADLAADQELQDALGKLGDVLGDVFGAKKNITGPQFSAADLLPALSKVVELLVRKGFRSFKAATARAAQLMRGNAATAPHVDAISPRQWKAAYNAIAEGHDGTDSEDAVAAMTADEVRGLVAAPEQAQNAAREPTQPPVGATDSVRGEAPGRGRGAPAQQRPAQVDPGDVGAREPGDVAPAPAAPAGRSPGEGPASPDVGTQEGSDGVGPAGDGRPRAGGTRDADARARSRGRKPAAGSGKPAPVDPASVSPANTGPGDFVIDDPLRIVGGGQVARFEKNKAAIELRNRLVEEGRAPTREEQEVLAGYTGWGSFGQELFQGNWERPAPKAGWEERDRWLRDNLGRKEWEGMQTSIINAHYTDPPTVLAMWDMVRRMGFTGGRVLEPSIGIGNFYGMMPADLTSRSQRAGIELDPVTGSMAQMLYPSANIQIKGYEKSTTPDNFYDLVIGNWPFFEQGPADRRYNRLSPTLHDYFFLKAIDQTKPGGLVVGITTHGTMDKKGIGARMEMARKAELVAAFRLPTGAFQEYAGTKVVTDIIILRKRAQPTDLVAKDGWIDVLEHNTAEGTKVWVNEYFHRHPEHVIGRIDFGHGTTTFRPGLIVHRPDNMMAELRRIVDMVPEGAFKADQTGKRISYVANHTSDRTNALVKTDKGLFIVQGEYLAPANEVLKYELKSPTKTAERVRELESLIDMRRLYGRLIDAERAGNADKERTALREAYEAFVKRSGTLADSFGLSYLERIDDPFYPSLAALEVDGKPAAILSRSTMRGARSIENPSISDAFVLARAEAVNPTLERIAAIAKKPQAEVKAALIESGAAYELPNGDFAAADIYLSGNVREKLRAAKAALESGNAAMQRNVDALTEVQPPTIPYYKIETQMGATWVPAAAYEEYIAHMLGMDKPDGISVKFEAGSWKVEMDGALNHRPQASSGAGVPHVKFKRLVRAAIANQTITVKRKDSDGVEYVDDTATKETNAAISDMRTKFGEWLWSDPTRRVQLEAEYNEVRNAYATPRFDGSFLGFQGMALSLGRGPFNLRQHQANAIWRALVTRKSLNAHEVGTGKTFTMGGIAVESRRYGIAKKPLILAHNANSKSVAHEIQQMYPAARVLYVDNLSKENVKTRMLQIANDDWDAVVVPHSLIGRIGFKEETLMGMAKEEIDDLELAAQEAAAEDNVTITKEMWEDEEELAKLRSATAKQLVKARLKIITTIQKLAQQASREDSVAFEDLGIDMVMVDEAHEFKKPPIATKMKMKGLQTATSDRSIALMFMTKYIRAMNGGANVHLFTGTPITNTMTEVFHMMRYMMQEEMKDAALADWDGWFGSFAREVTDVELNPAGEYEAVTRLQSFINVPELRRMIGQYMDVVFAEDMPEMQLRLVNGKRLTDKDLTDEQRRAILQGRTENALDRPYKKVVNENSDMTPEQLRVFERVQGYARSWRNMTKKDRKEAMLSGAPESPIIHEGIAARASFDARLVDAIRNAGLEGTPAMEPHPNSKPARVVKNLLEIYRSHPEANQVVFMEQGMAKSVTRREGPVGNKRNVNYPAFSTVHDMIERLVQAGVPREQIALVDGSTSKDKRKEVADAMNSGKIRIVFGSTDSLGVGVNMQRNLRAMHHMDAPWMPGEMEQRNGRGHRQGNQWNTVMEFRYLNDRLDGRRWQVLAIKQKFITDFMKSKGDVRVIEGDAADDSGGDILATFSEAAGDPRLLLREKYKKKLEHLQSRERIHGNAVADAKRAVRDETANMEDAERRLDALRQAGARDAIDALVKSTMGDGFNAVIGGEAFDERAPALIALRKWIVENVRKESPEQKVGTFGGHEVFVHWLYKWADEPSLVLKFPGDVRVTASPSWQSLETQLRNKRDTVEATWEEAIKTAREEIAHARKVTQEPFHLKAQLDDATKRLADLEEDIARNPVAPPYWLRSGAPADTDVVFNDKTFTVTGHRWSDAGWFVVARDDRGEIVIPYMEARDTQGMPLYEEREFEKPTVQQGTAAQGVPTKAPAAPKPTAADDLDFRIDAADLPADTAAAYAAAPSEADQRAVRRLQMRMARYIPGVRLDAVAAAGGREAGQPLQGADRARVAAAELLRALTGRRAVFFKADRAKFVNGVHSSAEPDVLFLRADASRPHMAVMGHEFLHGLRADRPDLYEALRDRIRLVAPGRVAHGADLQAKRASVAQPLLDADKLEEEFLADVMGDSWMDAGFWRDLAGKEPDGPLRKAFRAAFRFISDVLGKLADMNPFGSDVYLSDVRAARRAMAQALREYVEVESVGAPEIGVDSFSTDERAPWYSALERAIAAQPMRGGGAGAWENAVKGLIAAGKVKADEVEWSGLRDWLAMQPGIITKAAVQQYLKANGVQVQETVLGGGDAFAELEAAIVEADALGFTFARDVFEDGDEYTGRAIQFTRRRDGVTFGWNGRNFVVDDYPSNMKEEDIDPPQDALIDVARDIKALSEAERDGADADGTKYSQYTLPGGTNYREVLLTLPESRDNQRFKELGAKKPGTRTPAEDEEYRQIGMRGDTSTYRSNHWDQPNILAHIRVNDRTDADGKRVLFVEEIQSDWAQQGKREGFDNPRRAPALEWRDGVAKVSAEHFDGTYHVIPASGGGFVAILKAGRGQREAGRGATEAEARQAAAADFERARNAGKQRPPAAPFVDKTDKWVTLALKRIVKMAVDEGYDRVAMTTGKQQADRYGLDKQADKVVVTPRTDMRTGEKTRSVAISLKAGGVLTLGVDRNGVIDNVNGPIAGQHIEGKALDDVIGKEMAERVMAVERATFEGEDLRVGGRGMIAFYDRIVPSALKDLLRKVGGGQIGEVRLPGDGSRTYDDLTRLSDEIAARVYGQGTTYGSLPAESQAKVREMVKKRELQQPGFDITPKMREAAAGGMPMFSLAPRQQQTETPEFKRWFGDSKVVDAQGKPLVVYHGTRADITAFDGGRIKDRFPNSEGFYFTSSPRHASVYADSINNAAEEFDPTSRFIKPVAEGANVMPAYVSLQNPKILTVSEWGTLESRVDGDGGATVRAARAAGHDGVIVKRRAGDEYDGDLVIAFKPEQIKSATGNRGTFDPGSPDINFSIAVDALQSNDTARRLADRAMDVIRSDSTIGVLGRTVGTPYHLAHAKNADGSLRNPDLRKVYDEAQDYLNDINTFANDPAELAPGVVPMLNKWSDARNPLRLAGEKRSRLARALFEGTLGWKRDDQGNPVESDDARGAGIEWTATELKQRYGFDDEDVGRYQQARAAIARSLDFMAAAEVARQMGGRDLPEGLRAMVSRGDTGRFRGLVTNFLTQQVDGAKWALRMLKTEHREQLAGITGPEADAKRAALKAKQAIALEVAQERLDKWQGLQRGVAKVYDRVTDLKDRGYMPLMRFGPHTVTVRDIETRQVLFFGMYETQAEANVEARRLRESAAPNETVTRGEMSQEQWRLFKGMSPETIELFGQVAGVERTPVFEEYIRRTKANHSALKRLIQRKGTPGFSEDVQRVLAAFLTSNARAAAANLHAGAMEEATLAIDQERGLVKDYATRLTQYVQNPTDEAQAIRGLMFVQYIGGSVASAMVNMTQPFTMTLPYLSQHGGPGAAARLLTAGMRKALTKIDPQSPLGKAMQRAEKDGIVSPQALHELQGQAVNRFGRIESGLRALGVSTRAAEAIDANLRRVLFAWGGFFSLAEQFNRRATFIAAYQLAQERQMADPFEFASEAVSATQGVYNRGNRPQWARGPVGATVMTFKQFSISYLEFLSRLPRREKAIALGVLTLAAGLEGLPFADDLDDLIDTIMQRLFGKAFSAKRAKVEALTAMGMSRDSAEWVLRGASALPGFPVDLAGRMSLGNMIPGTGVLRTDGAKDKSSEVLEALGPAGGVVRDALRGEFSPVAVRNAVKGAEMFRTGQYRDELGRKVADVDGADAAAKALGFQPREIARESRGSRMAQSVVAQTRAAESDIVRLWAQGIADNEPDKIAEARAQLEAWNQRNPEARIAINRMQIARQVRDMRATREERLIRATPKELRGRVAQELQQ